MCKKYLMKSLSVITAFVLAFSTMACGAKTVTEDTAAVEASVEDTESDEEDTLTKTLESTGFGDTTSNADKEETVYVTTDANGTVSDVTVSNWLKNTGSDGSIVDSTNLTDIENVKGNETYEENEDGTITWLADGSDIYYRGSTDQELPVSMKITYTLDGKEVTPEELAGHSGHVVIRFDYTNNSKKTVEINGEDADIYTPFAMVSGTILDAGNFENVTVSSGKVISDGNNLVVMGVALPGLKDSLNLDDEKLEELSLTDDDVSIPDYVEIEADTSDFELPMTLTMATSNALSDLGFTDLSNSDKIDELGDDMDELQDGSTQLVDGTQELADGTVTLKDGTETLADGTSALKDGTQELADGTVTLKDGTSQLATGAGTLSDGITTYTDGVSQIADGAGKIDDGVGDLEDGVGTLKNGTKTLSSGIKSAKEGADKLVSGYTDDDGAVAGAKALSEGAAQVSTGVDTLASAVKTNADTYTSVASIIAENDADILQMNATTVYSEYIEMFNVYQQYSTTIDTLASAAGYSGNLNSSLNTELLGESFNSAAADEDITVEEDENTDDATDSETTDGTEEITDDTTDDNTDTSTDSDSSTEATSEDTSSDENVETTGDTTETVTETTEETTSDDTESTDADSTDTETVDSVDTAETTEETTTDTQDAETVTLNSSDDTEETETVEGVEQYSSDQMAAVYAATGVDESTWTSLETAARGVATAYSGYSATSAALTAYVTYVAAGDTTTASAYAEYAAKCAYCIKSGLEYAPYAMVGVTSIQTAYSTMVSSGAAMTTMYQGEDGTGGVKALQSGASQVSTGAASLYGGIKQLSDGTSSLQSGLKKLSKGGTKLYSGVKELDKGVGTLKDGTETLSSGASTLNDNSTKLKEGALSLANGAKDLDEGAGTLKDGASALNDGAIELNDGANELDDGVQSLVDGASELMDGMAKFDEEGIQKLTTAFDGDLTSFRDRLDAIEEASKEYTTFSGASDDSSSEVKFIIKTSGVEKDA